MIDLSSSVVSFSIARIALILIISLVYAAFDMLNNRNIPNSVAYASVAVGLGSVVFLQHSLIAFDLLMATVVAAISYLLYRIGQLGAGDGYEFVSIALLLPLQPTAYFTTVPQLLLPFILSVFVATGYVAVIVVPIYYLLVKRGGKIDVKPKRDMRTLVNSMVIVLAYVMLEGVLTYIFGFSALSLLLVASLAVPSAITIYYSEDITLRMVSEIFPRHLQDGDFIATNLMDAMEIKYFTLKYKKFGRLATTSLIKSMRDEKRKIPVYSDAVPLATITFLGVVISLLFGNILLNIV